MIITTKGEIESHTVSDDKNDVIFVKKQVENNMHTRVKSSLLFKRSCVKKIN